MTMRNAGRTLACAAGAAMLLGLCGCAVDGGVGGTGISSVIAGNVSGSAASAAALFFPRRRGAVEGIRVRERATGIETVTDATGVFRLEGDFAPLATLEFIEPDEVVSTLEVFIPAGGEVTLVDIRLRLPGQLAQMQAEAHEIQVDFEGFLLADATCGGDLPGFAVEDSSRAGNVFTVDLTPGTLFTGDGPAATPGCNDLRGGDNIRIRGRMAADGRIAADRVRLIQRAARTPVKKIRGTSR